MTTTEPQAPASPAPESPEDAVRAEPSRSLGLRLLATVAFLIVGSALQLLRTPGIRPWRSLLAEDGGIFLTDALNDPLVRTIGRAYEGYLHVVPRLLAAIASLAPVRDAAIVINVGAAVVVTLLALYVWCAARDVLPSQWGRSLLVLLMLLLPSAGWEVNASINNLHWYLDFAAFWVFIARPRTRGALVAGVLVAAAAALSDPLAALLVPLAAYRALQALRRRDGIGRPVLVAPVVFVVCLALQALYGVAEKPPHAFVEVDPLDVPGTYGLRIVGTLLFGDRFLQSLFVRFGNPFALACLLVGVLAAAASLRVVVRRRRPTLAVVFGYSAVFLAVPLLIRGTSIYLDRENFTLNGSRYMLAPALLLAAGVLIAVFRPRSGARAGAGALAPRVAVTVLVLSVVGASFSMRSIRSGGPDWPAGVRAAEARCLAAGGDQPGSGGSAANPWATIVGPGQALVPTAPGLADLSSWNVVVDCSRLDRPVTPGR